MTFSGDSPPPPSPKLPGWRLRLLELAVERTSVGVTITDEAGRIIYVNPADAALHGYAPAELIGRSAQIYSAPGAVVQSPPAPVCWRRETLNRTRDGRAFPVRLISDAVLDEDGRLQALVTLCEDLTEVRRALEAAETAQAALADQQAVYRQIIEGASDLIQSLECDGRFRFVNRAWMEALGYSWSETGGLTVWDILPPEQHAPVQALLARVLAEGQPDHVETVFRGRSGREIRVEGSIGVLREPGWAPATLGIFRDVTERRRVERMKQEFLAIISHELRTPLASMLGSLGLVRSPRVATDPAKVRELLEIAERNGHRLLRLINDLIDLQRLEAGILFFQLVTVQLRDLLDRAVRDARELAGLYGVLVHAETDDVRLVTDPDRLAQVLNSLLSNAVKFSPAGGEVWVEGRDRGSEIELIVRDQGPGIPEELKGRLFEKFAQADTTSVRQQGGVGLGLAIAKKVVEGLGGTITLDSTPDTGTTVAVRLPRHAA